MCFPLGNQSEWIILLVYLNAIENPITGEHSICYLSTTNEKEGYNLLTIREKHYICYISTTNQREEFHFIMFQKPIREEHSICYVSTTNQRGEFFLLYFNNQSERRIYLPVQVRRAANHFPPSLQDSPSS